MTMNCLKGITGRTCCEAYCHCQHFPDKYKIVRGYLHGPSRTINTGLTLEQAQAHCKDPETSSSTCKLAANKARTRWKEGEVVVFIFDTQTREMVWQGSAMAEVTLDAPLDRRLERLDKAMKTMFTSFPGRPRVQPHESTGG